MTLGAFGSGLWVLACALALQFAIPSPAYAQITTDGTLGPRQALSGPDVQIPAELGRRLGGNLFHSFGLFNINTGERATFTGPSSISNVIGRITGGQASHIDGALRSEIAGADLYLINPAGILFGPNASLDVSGSFHASTADYLRLGDGGRFDAKEPQNSVLSAAPPSAFGFLGPTPTPISVDRSRLEVPERKTISLIGGDISIRGRNEHDADSLRTNSLATLAGRINLASVASAGEVRMVDEPADVQVDSFKQLGQIRLWDQANLNARGDGGGTVVIRGGHFLVESSDVSASVNGPTDGSKIDHRGAGIDIAVSGDVVLDGSKGWSEVRQNVVTGVAGDAGGVRVRAKRVEVKGKDTDIVSAAFAGSTGNAGAISIEAETIDIHSSALIRSNTGGSGNSGGIVIRARRLSVRDDGSIETQAFGGGSGNAGNIDIVADEVRLSNDPWSGVTGIQSATYGAGTGAPGNIKIATRELAILPGAEISSTTRGAKRAGRIEIEARNISISAEGYGGIFANSFGSGRGGELDLRVADLIRLTGDNASLQAGGLNTGAGGNMRIRADTLEVQNGAFVSVSGRFGLGVADSGNMAIDVKRLIISGLERAQDPFGQDATALFSGAKDGRGGEIQVSASEEITLTNRGAISSSSFGAGQGGNVKITAPRLQILSGSEILASAFGAGDGGSLGIAADELVVSGVHPQPFTDTIGQTSLAVSAIAAQAGAGGAAGRVTIRAANLRLLDGGRISTETFGHGEGGSIAISAGEVAVGGLNRALRDFLIAGGKPLQFAEEAARSGILAGSQDGRGAGGDIELSSGRVTLHDGGRISARSAGDGRAGDIQISATDRFESRGGVVTTDSERAGGGSIALRANDRIYLIDSAITTSVRGGGGDAGNISIDPRFVILNNSRITANAFEGTGGNIRIVADNFIASADSKVDASSALGIDGVVEIRSPDAQLGAGLDKLPAAFLDASALLTRRCAIRAQSKASSFVVVGRASMAADPDASLWGGYAEMLGGAAPSAPAGAVDAAGAVALLAPQCGE